MDRAVFINYRGEDSHSYGAMLYQELRGRFGEDRVFLDCESIPAGADFVAELLSRVRSAPVLLAVIGPRWLTATDTAGRRRIDNPDDWIRRELVEAFTAGVTVIPVLTEQSAIPAEADLPAEIAALSRCQYRRLRHHDSTADLARIVTDLTRLDPTLAAIARSRDGAPRQLIGAPRHFVGRVDQLDALDRALTTPDNPTPDNPTPDDSSPGDGGQGGGTTAVISAIGGTGGIGKTWLALTWANRNLHRFPDGQLFVDLRGFSPDSEPMPPEVAVRGFLDALGVEPGRIPVEPHAQAALFRSLVAGKRMLLVLDNAASAAQLTPLLPGSETCTVLITSRNRLPGLITTHAAHHLSLDVLSDVEARALLTNRLGVARIEAEPAVVDELIGSCGGFPLALSIVASHAQLRPHLSLATLAAELRDLGLSAFDEGDSVASLPTVLSWSYRALAPEQATAFALLGIAPGPDISLLAAAELTDLPVNATRAVLRGLEQMSLLSQESHGRYRMHDLIRLYATELAGQLDNAEREAAMHRVINFYLRHASAANWMLDPFPHPLPFDLPEPSVDLVPFGTRSTALMWFTVEYQCLLSAQRAAVGWGWHLTVLQFAYVLGEFQYRQGHRHDRLTVWREALAAAQRLREPAMEASAHTRIGDAYAELDQHDEAIEHVHRALALFEYLQDRIGQAQAHQTLSWAWTHREDSQMALHHATQALKLARAANNPLAEAYAYSEIGLHTARLGDYDHAREHCQAALLRHRDLHDHDGEAHVLDTLGYIDHHSGRHHQAVDHYQQALSLYRDLGHDFATANTLEQLGYLHSALDQKQQAGVMWREALELYQRQGRDDNAKRVQLQLDALGHSDGPEPTDSTK